MSVGREMSAPSLLALHVLTVAKGTEARMFIDFIGFFFLPTELMPNLRSCGLASELEKPAFVPLSRSGFGD